MSSRTRSGNDDDASVFTALFRRHHPAVVAFCVRRTTDEHEARDCAAETFTVAWRRLRDAHEPSLPWLLAIARHVLSNRRRGDVRAGALVSRLATEVTADAAGGHADAVHERMVLCAALARLSADDREALALWAWEDLPSREAAATLGIAAGAYRVRLLRARRRLRRHLEAEADGVPERAAVALPAVDPGSNHA